MRRPNIIWIIPDDTNHGILGYGGGQVLSPNIDSISRQGVVFDQFHCVSPACGPSRYNYLSGHYGGRCPSEQFQGREEPYNIFFNALLDPGREQSLGHALQGAGYRTGHVGKWHVGGSREDEQAMPKFDPDDDPRQPAVADKMKAHQEALCGIVRKAGFDYARSVVWGNYQTLPRMAVNHNIEWITKGGLDFIDHCAGEDAPFFLSMATTTIHGPNHVSSLLADPHLTGGGYADDHIGCQASRQSIYERLCQSGIEFNSTTAGVLWMDDAIGAILDKLRQHNLEQDTVVIFSGDHGPSLGGKFTTYQRGARIPCTMQWPGSIPGGRVIGELTQNVDFLPTMLDLVGADLPDGLTTDGQSLLPLVTGKQDKLPGRDDLYFEFGYTRAVRTERWKYIAWRLPKSIIESLQSGEMDSLCTHFGRRIPTDKVRADLVTAALLNYPHYFEPDQLYDLENDPYERENLADNPEHQAILADMKARLQKYLDTFTSPFPLDQPDPFYSSPRFEELRAAVAENVKRSAAPWLADMKYIGFHATAEGLAPDDLSGPSRCPLPPGCTRRRSSQ